MITDKDLTHTYDPENLGLALCWIINKEVLYDLPLDYHIGKMFLDTDNAQDISRLYPYHEGITVRLMKGDLVLEDFQTTEYFGSILLSNPLVVNLDNHKRGSFVVSPNAKFHNYEFYPNVMANPNTMDPWYPHQAPPNGLIANCYSDCNCGWTPNA